MSPGFHDFFTPKISIVFLAGIITMRYHVSNCCCKPADAEKNVDK